jgi:hypothetical protein
MREVLVAFFSQNIRRFFWLIVLVSIIIVMASAGEKAEALKWCGILAGVALTQIRSNTADPERTPAPTSKKEGEK